MTLFDALKIYFSLGTVFLLIVGIKEYSDMGEFEKPLVYVFLWLCWPLALLVYVIDAYFYFKSRKGKNN